MGSDGVPYTGDLDCRSSTRLKKSLFLDRVDELRAGVFKQSGMISDGGEGHMSAMLRHVSSVLVVPVVDEGELLHTHLCEESERSDEMGDTARDVDSSAEAEEKCVVSWIKFVSKEGVGSSDGGRDSGTMGTCSSSCWPSKTVSRMLSG